MVYFWDHSSSFQFQEFEGGQEVIGRSEVGGRGEEGGDRCREGASRSGGSRSRFNRSRDKGKVVGCSGAGILCQLGLIFQAQF